MTIRNRMVSALVFAVALVFSGSPAFAYDEAPVTSGGTIKGKVTYTGSIPTRKVIPTKDQQVCGGIRDEPLIIRGPGNGVRHAVAYLKNVDKGKKWNRPQKAEIVNTKCQFEPHMQALPIGMTVTIVNSDPVLHNTHGFVGRATVFNLALPREGMRVDRVLRRPGIMRVECDAHGWMLAWVYVAVNPYYDVTDPNGSFTISDVPPGDYTLVIWHEYLGEDKTIEQQVTVKPGGTTSVEIELKK